VVVLGAYAPEVAALGELLLGENAAAPVTRLNGIPLRQGTFAGHHLLVLPTGISMVNAAMTTQLILERYPVRAVFFAGIAGGIDPNRHIGDVVIPERWYHHSEAVYANPLPDATGHRLPSFFQPRYENFGFMYPDEVWAWRDGMDQPVKTPFFPADPDLLQVASQALSRVPPMEIRGRTATVTLGGNGVSGPVFMDHRDYRQWVFRVWQASCLDMESTAVAQVCWANQVPCLIIRALSDLAGGQDDDNDIQQTEAPVSRHAALVLREILRTLPPAPPLTRPLPSAQ
jgi:adenosylhomocysteine nucleosidase